MPESSDVDGKVWMNSVGLPGVHRVDLCLDEVDTSSRTRISPRRRTTASTASMPTRTTILFFFDFSSNFRRQDRRQAKDQPVPTPTPNSNPRRGYMDAQDRVWFAEYRANKVAMLNSKSEQFTEWPLPTPTPIRTM